MGEAPDTEMHAKKHRMSAALDTLSQVLATVKRTTVHGQSALQHVLPATAVRTRSRSRGGRKATEHQGTRSRGSGKSLSEADDEGRRMRTTRGGG